jgi:hypothetical protein
MFCPTCQVAKKGRPVTYQVAFSGKDGMVLASDRRESLTSADGFMNPIGDVQKIYISGPFAWAFSGGPLAMMFSDYVRRREVELDGMNVEQAKQFFESCGRPVVDSWRETAAGPGGVASQVVLVCGQSKQIFSSLIATEMNLHKQLPVSQAVPEQQPPVFKIAGQHWNFASFIPWRLYDPNMPIDALATLASYAVWAAGEFDSSCIGELDVAVYRDSDAKFTMPNPATYWERAKLLDAALRDCICRQ